MKKIIVMMTVLMNTVICLAGNNSKTEGYWISPPSKSDKGLESLDKSSNKWVILDSGTLGRENNLQKMLLALPDSRDGKIELILPNITNIENGIVGEGNQGTGAFSECDALKSVEIPKVERIGDYTFTRCKFLSDISMAKDIKLGKAVFYNADKFDFFALGAQYADRFLPLPDMKLSSDLWGCKNVLPRHKDNGIEDDKYSYWGGNIVKGDDGKYHIFVARWPESAHKSDTRSGHMMWSSSEVAHAISDTPYGPFKVVDVLGKGHNPEIYRKKDGSYIVGVMGLKHYKAQDINGPWTLGVTTMKFSSVPQFKNTSNRTYIVEEDGTIFMMNKEGFVFESKSGDENFVGIENAARANKRRGASHEEDPVIWKDEICYNMIMNDAHGRMAYHFTSKDGRSEWTREDGLAYTHTETIHSDGRFEKWWKLERPKVMVDEYGRPTYMNFAVIDTIKSADKANDIHSSKNIVIPMMVARRMELVGKFNPQSTTATIKFLAEEGFNPHKDINIKSLRFGSSMAVNRKRGAKVVKTKKDGKNLIITFKGEMEFSPKDYKAKIIGLTKNNKLLWSYVRID